MNIRGALFALVIASLGGCGSKGTFALVTIARDATVTGTVATIELQLTLGGTAASTTLSEPNDGTISFPTTATLEIDSGSGTMNVIAIARDHAQGVVRNIIGSATGNVDVVRDKTVDLALTLTSAGPGLDMGTADLAGVDLTGADLSATGSLPGVPKSVAASSGDAQVTVTWLAPDSDGGSPITGYQVTSTPGAIVKSVTTTSVTFTGLTNGTAYTFDVVAQNANGDGPAATSNAATPTATPTAPGSPGTPSAVVGGPLSATVTWTAANNNGSAITKYTVISTPGALTAFTPDGTTLSATVPGLTAGTMYTFGVIATNGIGPSPESAQSNSITAVDVPSMPTNVAICNGSVNAKISYTLPANATGANVYYKTTAGVTKANGTKVAGVANPAIITGLTSGTQYYYMVVAVNAAGESVASAEVTAFATALPHDRLFVSNLGNGRFDIFDCIGNLASGSGPTRSISDANIVNPQYGSIAIDDQKGIVYLATGSTTAGAIPGVLMWDNITDFTISGAKPPSRILSGVTNAKFGGIRGIAVDALKKRLYVQDSSGGVRVWTSSDTVNGDVAPVAAITGFSSVNQLFLDENADRLYVVEYSNGTSIFNNASTLAGTVSSATATRKLSVTVAGVTYIGVGATPIDLYQSSYANGAVYRLTNYNGDASGAYAPTSSFIPTGVTKAGNIFVQGTTLYYVPDSSLNVLIFNSPVTTTGTPDKTFSLPSSSSSVASIAYSP